MSYLVTEWGAAAPEKPTALSHGAEQLSPGVIAPRLQQAAQMKAQTAAVNRVGAPKVGAPIAPSRGASSLPVGAVRGKTSESSAAMSRIQGQTAARVQHLVATRPAQQPIALRAPAAPSGPEISTSSASPETLQRFNPMAAVSRLRARVPATPRTGPPLILQTTPDAPPEVVGEDSDGGRMLLDLGPSFAPGDSATAPATSPWPRWAPWAAAGLGVVIIGGIVYYATKGKGSAS
jgi:hypothetical protein